MISVRRNVFETNSSSSHSLIIGTFEEMNDWEAGRSYYDKAEGKFIKDESLGITPETLKEAERQYKKEYASPYSKSWESLDKKLQEQYAREKVLSNIYSKHYNEDVLTYEQYQKDLDNASSCASRVYTTPQGEYIKALSYVNYS